MKAGGAVRWSGEQHVACTGRVVVGARRGVYNTGVPRPEYNAHPPRTPLGPYTWAYGRVLGVCVFVRVRYLKRIKVVGCRGLVDFYTYRGTSLMRKRTPLGPYCRSMPRVLGGF